MTTPIDIRLMTMEGRLPGTKAVAQVWAQDLQKIGVNLQITDLAQQLFVDNWNKGDYDIAIWGTGDGNGLSGMTERAAALGGTLDAGPRPGGGFRVHAMLPRDASPKSPGSFAPRANTPSETSP